MESLIPKITNIGLAALFNTGNDGLDAAITHIAFGDGDGDGYTPSGNETGLVREKARVAIGGGERVGQFEIEVQALLDEGSSFWIREIGFMLQDGTMLALWSDPQVPLAYKTAGVPLVVAYNLALQGIPPDSITVLATGPQVNITITGPLAQLSAELIRLQRRIVESEIARLEPQITENWRTS